MLESQGYATFYDVRNAYRRLVFGEMIHQSINRSDALKATGCRIARSIAEKLDKCCQYPLIIQVDGGESFYLAESRCRSRICPRCSKIRANMLAGRIAAMVRLMDAPRFLTLTIRSNEQALSVQLKHLRRRFAALRRTELWKYHVKSGVYTIEITWNRETKRWHPHLHCIIDGSFFPHQSLLSLWERVVKDQAGIDIRMVVGVRKLANYLACYVSKSCDLSHLSNQQLAEWAVATAGLRLAQTFGGLQTCKPSKDRVVMKSYKMVDCDVNWMAYIAGYGCTLAKSILTSLTGGEPLSNPDFLVLVDRFNTPPSKQYKPDKPRPKDLQLRLAQS